MLYVVEQCFDTVWFVGLVSFPTRIWFCIQVPYMCWWVLLVCFRHRSNVGERGGLCQLDGPLHGSGQRAWEGWTQGLPEGSHWRSPQHSNAYRLSGHAGESTLIPSYSLIHGQPLLWSCGHIRQNCPSSYSCQESKGSVYYLNEPGVFGKLKTHKDLTFTVFAAYIQHAACVCIC